MTASVVPLPMSSPTTPLNLLPRSLTPASLHPLLRPPIDFHSHHLSHQTRIAQRFWVSFSLLPRQSSAGTFKIQSPKLGQSPKPSTLSGPPRCNWRSKPAIEDSSKTVATHQVKKTMLKRRS